MSLRGRREPVVLVVGDLLAFFASLWLSLLLRHLSWPGEDLFALHFGPFCFLFAVSLIVFYIAGLYEKHTVILQSRLPSILSKAQATNSGLAIAFFYLIPFLEITPKALLFIYLVVSFGVVYLWRRYGYFLLNPRRVSQAILVGSGEEMKELLDEVNHNPVYNISFVSSVDLESGDGEVFWDELVSRIYSDDISVIAIDLSNEKVEPILPHLYNLIFSKVNFIDMHKIYEDIFDRVPLSLLKYNWFLENISTSPRGAYDVFKRVMDISISLPLTLISLVLYPFVITAIKLEDRGPIFISQKRVGKRGRAIKLWKFRSMERNDAMLGSQSHNENRVTKVGKFLRETRIDELPQLWSVIKGDLSLIGPRPELPSGVALYTEEIPYYNIRHLIKPGLSGWAQIYHDQHPHHGVNTEETKRKLSYDLYYIKNRSFLLDLKIALRTIQILFSMAGR